MNPIDKVIWVDRCRVRPNDYNPNSQVAPNHALLIESIRQDGWTTAIVVRPADADGIHVIIDGEHRWKASETLGESLIPVVVLDKSDEACIASTVRHNRARGSHGVKDMADLVRMLRDGGMTQEEVSKALGMSRSELERMEISEEAFLYFMGGYDKTMQA